MWVQKKWIDEGTFIEYIKVMSFYQRILTVRVQEEYFFIA